MMMTDRNTDTLWMKFAEDTSLPLDPTPSQKDALNHIFDQTNPQSLWSRALAKIGREQGISGAPPILKWVGNTPYMNWNNMVALVMGRGAYIRRQPDNAYKIEFKMSVLALWDLIKIQWHVSEYLSRIQSDKTQWSEEEDQQIVESLALGLCLLALTQRLKYKDEQSLAKALSQTEFLKTPDKKTIEKIAAIQKRRTSLTPAWQKKFPAQNTTLKETGEPYFWNNPTLQHNHDEVTPHLPNVQWKGIGVSGYVVIGRIVMLTSPQDIEKLDNPDNDPLIAVFPHARPETVEIFSQCTAVLFGSGGALSHACTIAREQNKPCITALGTQFMTDMTTYHTTGHKVWVSIDPQIGHVQLVET